MSQSRHRARARRSAAVQACVERFSGAVLDYRRADCVRLAKLAMVKQGVTVPILKGITWRSEAGALRAFAKSGFRSLIEGVDATGLQQIAPAEAWRGDLLAIPAEGGSAFGCALALQLDAGNILAPVRINPDDDHFTFAVIEPRPAFLTAWRVG